MSDILLVRGARQLLTLHGPAEVRRGAALRELGIIEQGALLARNGVIEEVGPARRIENLALARHAREIDATGRVVMPGFVDSHTHLADGDAVRTTSARRLQERLRAVLADLARHGTTTVEVKVGYGGDTATESKVLRVLTRLSGDPLDIALTYMAGLGCAGPLPPAEWERLLTQVLPGLARKKTVSFLDLFVRGALGDLAGYGFPLKVHADAFGRDGGTLAAVEHKAVSADHLVFAGPEEVEALAGSATVATLLPGAGFYRGVERYAPARTLIDAGAAVALATGCNPANCPTFSMPMVVSLACFELALTPAEAITAATINGAHALQRAERVGSLEVGKLADLLILNASDYREVPGRFGVNPVHATIKRGRLIYREGPVGFKAY